ncbi:MAG: hypothetical protein RLZZ308_289 [Candidatus Parcubacteria bacterium]|jgi:hypothetical protein
MLRDLIKKTLAGVYIISMLFSGVDPATLSYVVYQEVIHPRGKVVDMMYLASKNPNVVDVYFKGTTVHAAVNSGEREYVVDIGPVDGSASANYVYASFMNPSGSGRTASIKRIAIRSNTTSSASNYVNLTMRRISTSSGGAQITATNYPKKNTASSDSVVEIRQAGPSVTLSGTTDSRIIGQPLSGAVGAYQSGRDITFGQNDEKLVIQPGEGVAVYQEAAGTTNSKVLVLIEWDETVNAPASQDEFLYSFPRVEANAAIGYTYNSFFNPSSSGKTAIVKRIWFGSETCDAAAVYTNNLVLQRISASTGGTQVTSTNIPKKNTSSADSVMEFRHTNPTETVVGGADARIANVTPCGAAGQASGWQQLDFYEGDEKLILQQGEGVALLSETAGDTDQLVRMIIEWQEVSAANTPTAEGGYLWASSRVESASAANTTHYSFFNPSGSGKVAVIKRLVIRINADTTANYVSFSFRRITAASGGTLIATSSVPQKNTDSASSTMQIRWCGSACASVITATYSGTTDSNILSVNTPGAVGQTIGQREIVFEGNEKIILQEGEGIGLYNSATADVDDYIKIMVEWDEEASAPSSQGEYIVDIGPINGSTATSYNYATFFNPVGSGKTAIIRRVSLRVDAVTTAVYIPMQLRRIASASAGTQITAANIPKKHTGSSNSIMEIRRTGVTATYSGTTDSKLLAIQTPGAVASASAGNTGYKDIEFSNREYIVLQPGEGVGLYHDTSAGDVDFRVKMLIEWDEESSSPSSQSEYLMTTGPVNQATTQGYVYSSLFNPSGSGKNYLVRKIAVRADRSGTGVAPVYTPLAIRRVTTASGGTLIASSSIPKKHSSTSTSTAEVRTTGLSATFSGATSSRLLGVTTPGAVNQVYGDYESTVYYGDELVIKEGEGLAFYQEQTQGDALVRYRFLFEWDEESNAAPAQSLTLILSTSTIYLGQASPVIARYASSTNSSGSDTEVEAHTLQVLTNASNGYMLTVRGQTLNAGIYTVNAIGGTNTVSTIGTEQFGLRVTSSGGSGTVTAPYAASGFAYAGTATTSSQVASASVGDNATTTFSVRYVTNISALTEPENYTTGLVYVVTANF